jgi:hypothetical protein
VKLNTDASFIGENQPRGAGVIKKPIPHCIDKEDVEEKGALIGIRLLEGLGHNNIVLELECASTARPSKRLLLADPNCGTPKM